MCVQFHAASLSNFSHKQGIAVATKAGGGKHKIQINGIRLANRTSFSMCTKPRIFVHFVGQRQECTICLYLLEREFGF